MQPDREPQFSDLAAAAERLAGRARETPLFELAHPASGATLLLKAECLQLGGAFKFRGAYNRLAQLSAAERAAGVVAWSSGNHAQGVALAASQLGIPATIVMPKDAPRIKVEQTQRHGVRIVFYDRYSEDRERIGTQLAAERGATIVPPFDDAQIIAGQGTAAIEMVTQAHALCGRSLDVLLVPCGGGGLVAGCALAIQRLSPGTKVYSVEPEGFDDTARSLASGRHEKIRDGARSLCDALMAPTPGRITLPVNRRLLAGGLSVSDEMVFEAMRYACRELRLIVEPGGAVALAAALHGVIDLAGRTVGVMLSGGNVDPELYARVLSGRPD